jgi:hypothetical protein
MSSPRVGAIELADGSEVQDEERATNPRSRKTMTKKNVKMAKEEVVNVRMTARQKETLEAVATRQGLGVSTWLLHVGLLRAEQEGKS